jgi:hypothetical protein
MGGTGGEIRGKTKLEVYKKFRSQVNRKDIEESTGLYMGCGDWDEAAALRPHAEGPEDRGVGFVLSFW